MMTPCNETRSPKGRFNLQVRDPCQQKIPRGIEPFIRLMALAGLEPPIQSEGIEPSRGMLDACHGDFGTHP